MADGQLDDQREIANLLARYPELFDAGDFAGFAELFAHGTWFATAAQGAGVDVVRRWCEANVILYDGVPHTRHVVTNLHLDVEPANGRAEARSYVTIWQALADFPLQAIFVGRYHDTLARRGGAWCFTERRVFPDLMGDLSRHMRNPPPPGPLHLG